MQLKEKPDYKEIDAIMTQYTEPEHLIRILQKVQDIYGYLSEDVQIYIADKLKIPVSEVNGVVTFYSLFSTKPKGKHIIGVCLGTACYVKGANDILKKLKSELKINEDETTKDGVFTLRATRCIGACGLAPVITIGDDVHGRINADDIPRILEKYGDSG
ncbi:MAG: NADH-quinone oxidoreductase subunit NuoE [Firmicutes bacterium]|nr:NADH-quinone oxidoreductase subunit NuoE [Bacillota bacterium]